MKVCLFRRGELVQYPPMIVPSYWMSNIEQPTKVYLHQSYISPSEDTPEATKNCQNIVRCLVKSKFWGTETYKRLAYLHLTLKKNPGPENMATVTVESDCFSQLCRVLGNDIKLQVALANRAEENEDKFNLLTEEMAIKTLDQEETENDEQDSKRTRMDLFCEDKHVAFLESSNEPLFSSYDNKMLIWLIIPSWNMLSIRGNVRDLTPLSDIGLEDPDAKMVTADESSFIECHSKVLAAQGKGFKTLFEIPGKTDIILDLNVYGLLALRDYLYERELSKPFIQPQIALDLLRAGNQYEISSLLKDMTDILLETPVENFHADEAVRLFHFSRIPSSQAMQHLKLKSVQIMKSKALNRDLEMSEEFRKLFMNKSPAENIEVVMELITIALSTP